MVAMSVIMPTFNKAEYLELTLASFSRQTFNDFEIIVVNDGSTDRTADFLASWGDARVRVLTQVNAGRSAARNAGVAVARGEWVVFSDDDRLVHPDFLAAHIRSLQADGNSVVVGLKRRVLTRWRRGTLPLEEGEFRQLCERSPTLSSQLEGAACLQLCTREDVTSRFEAVIELLQLGKELDNHEELLRAYGDDLDRVPMSWMLATTANMSLARRHLDGVRTFDERYRGWGVEDNDLAYRLHLKGLAMRFDRSAVNYHQVHPYGNASLVQDATRLSEECGRNFLRFCAKFDALEGYLLWLVKLGMGLERAHALLRDAEQDAVVHDDLIAGCRQLLSNAQAAAQKAALA